MVSRRLTGIILVFVLAGGGFFFLYPSLTGGIGGTNTTTSTTTSGQTTTTMMSSGGTTSTSTATTTIASSDGQVCTTTEVTDTNGNTKTNDDCSWLRFIGLSTLIDGQQIYDSSTGKSGQITKKATFTHTPSKPVKSTSFQVGIDAYIGSTKIASNNTFIRLDGSPSSLRAISLTLTGLKLESYSYLFQSGGTLRYIVNGNETFAFTDSSILSQRFSGSVGNASLTFQANSPTVTSTDECGGCPLNPSGSAYTIPNGSGTLTIAIVCNTDVRTSCPTPTAWAPAAGGSISATYLCWDASKLTQPCSISPSSFSGTLNSNSEYSFQITSVTVGSFNGYYVSGGTVICCAPQYAPVGYSGSVKFVTPFKGQCMYDVITGELRSCTYYDGLPIQFVVAESPTASKVGATVYISPPCGWLASARTCSA